MLACELRRSQRALALSLSDPRRGRMGVYRWVIVLSGRVGDRSFGAMSELAGARPRATGAMAGWTVGDGDQTGDRRRRAQGEQCSGQRRSCQNESTAMDQRDELTSLSTDTSQLAARTTVHRTGRLGPPPSQEPAPRGTSHAGAHGPCARSSQPAPIATPRLLTAQMHTRNKRKHTMMGGE